MLRGICCGNDGSCQKLCKHATAVFLKLEHFNTSYNIANKERSINAICCRRF